MLKPFIVNENMKTTNLSIAGLVLDAFGNPFSGFKAEFFTIPTTIN